MNTALRTVNLGISYIILSAISVWAQPVDVDVNWNIVHSVNGVSNLDRERYFTVHASMMEPDWEGEEDMMDYLMNDLDVYFGRDNGSGTWKFSATEEDPARPNHPDIDFMHNFAQYLHEVYDAKADRHQYEPRQQEMIMGTNPHPTYPTLSWYSNGFTWTGWQPKDVETSAEFYVEHLDNYFRQAGETSGEPAPMYWEVINEPDMVLMTGQFMVSNWESIWEYHNLVATGVRDRMGADAPLIGGMTWGLHDLHNPDLARYDYDYLDQWITDPDAAQFYRDAATTAYPQTDAPWEQWDTVWQGFIDNCGANMDFYSIHLYDWPGWQKPNVPTVRAGGHVECLLDTLEWYDIHKFGEANRKPVIVSEYGAVGDPGTTDFDMKRYDWESLKPFNAMLMQFLERPDYIVKTMPFTPIKATWGDVTSGNDFFRYPYTMMRQYTEGGEWEWTEYIKFYQLWSGVDGTRAETKASDLDIQVDAYVDGDTAFLILNNLEPNSRDIQLHHFGLAGNTVQSTRIRHLYLDLTQGTEGYPQLDDYTVLTAPARVTLEPYSTMVLEYTFAGTVVQDQSLAESKFYGNNLSGAIPFRVNRNGTPLTAQINNVTVPAGPAEATLRISGMFWWDFVTQVDSRNVITINGNQLDYLSDWRGEYEGNRWLGTLEVPVPIQYLQASNTIECTVLNSVDYTCVNLQVFDYSQAPGRSENASAVAVTGVSVSPPALSLPEQRMDSVVAQVAPANATNPHIIWSTETPSVAIVDVHGNITALSAGQATITATTDDGGFTDTVTVTVTSFVPFAVEGVNVNPAIRSVRIGETAPLTANVLPVNAANSAVTWGSSNTGVAIVDASGVVTAVAVGNATITATTVDGSLTDTSQIVVPPPIAVNDVTVTQTSALLAVGGTMQLGVNISPHNAEDQTVAWYSLTPGIASVDSEGVVTALAEGEATIVATTNDGGFSANTIAEIFRIRIGGSILNIQAENFDSTGGVVASAIGINTVQSGDWAEYNILVPQDGIYGIKYLIGTPVDGDTNIKLIIDGVLIATDAVPITGGWDDYEWLESATYAELTEGAAVLRVSATGDDEWQWNLDKIVLTRVDSGTGISGPVVRISNSGGAIPSIHVSNGIADDQYQLLATTDLSDPDSWQVVESTVVLDDDGIATIVPTDTGDLRRFFILKSDDGTPPPPPPGGTSATFTFEGYAGNWWDGAGYTEAQNGLTLVSGGRAFAHDGGDGAGGTNGFSLKANYPQDTAPGSFKVQASGVDQGFTLVSLDMSADDGGIANSVYIQGMLAGIEQWRINPAVGSGYSNYSTATTGSLNLEIDEILWHGPSEDPGGTVWDNEIDNMQVSVASP